MIETVPKVSKKAMTVTVTRTTQAIQRSLASIRR